MSAIGDCFIVLPPHCADNCVIIGRNAEDAAAIGVAQEILFYEADEIVNGKADGGATPELSGDRWRVILQNPKAGAFGADFGANERNVCIGVTWSKGESGNDCLLSTDVVRFALATSQTAVEAVELSGSLVSSHGGEGIFNLLICDPKEVWLFSCSGKLWAAQQVKEGFLRIPSGLAVTTTIDKSSDGLEEALKVLGAWNGEDPLNFAACFDALPSPTEWTECVPTGDGGYILTSMFDTLRANAKASSSRASNVSVLNSNGISCHWFTATPNATESVFKPFVFAPQPKISPLTKVPADSEITLLHKLHDQRKPSAMLDLKQLEASCVEEVLAYLSEHPVADGELDELLKDCVEAEVKFYR